MSDNNNNFKATSQGEPEKPDLQDQLACSVAENKTTIRLCGPASPPGLQYQASVLSPPSPPLCLALSLRSATLDLNYRLAAGLLASLPVCASKRHEICITLIPVPCQLFHISSSRMYE